MRSKFLPADNSHTANNKRFVRYLHHLKQSLSILILIAITFQIGIKTSVIIWFESNKTQIAQTLCVNKDEPELECHGKCILAQKLKQAENKQNQMPLAVSEIDNEIMPCLLISCALSVDNNSTAIMHEKWMSNYSFFGESFLFRPPSVVG